MSGIKEQEFKIMSLSAEKLISRYEVRTDSNNNAYISYSLKKDDSFYIKSTEKYSDNALFYQIRKVTNAPSDCGDEFLMDKIVYVNCGSLFSKYTDNNEFKISYTVEELKPYSNKINLSYRLKKLFEQGIYIDFGDGNEVKFIPFDKSNSMARQNKISFIRADLRDELNQRLNLDIPFKKQLQLSKFYSYRGLYMSDSHRVAWNSEEVRDILNSETVIVIKDPHWVYKLDEDKKYKIISAKEDTSDKNIKGKWDIQYLDNVEFDIYDGEGIVSKEYSKLISKKLGIGNASSFQIRMPFTKGMLHEVDFHKLVPEIVEEVTHEKDVKSYMIEDFFGNQKDIMKAQIILPASMFKCAKWLSDELDEKDPVEYYFDKFYKYDHALYVIKTNLNYGKGAGNISYTSLNYQFFNTLDFSEEDLLKLINQYRSWIRDPLYYYKNIYSSSLFDSDEEYGDADGMDDKEKEKYTTWQYALKYSDDFCRDEKIKGILTSLSNKLKMDLLLGRIIVPGEVRFLSRDLLAFFVDILKFNEKFESCMNGNKPSYVTFLKKHCLVGKHGEHFFMPGNKINLIDGYHYPIFRSPHLSRNEQCALKYYSASTTYDSIIGKNGNYYRKYFSHLTGVLFVSCSELAPLILGGADFDGDTIKIISDESVRKAVLSGVYENYKRKLDIVTIPSGKSSQSYLNADVDFNTIRNTFDNKIGQISNNSIRLGKYEYGQNLETEHKCYECTIFTGLEIDAAKTGKHPTYSLNEFIKYVKTLEEDNENADYMKFKTLFTESSLYSKSQKNLSRYLGPKNIEIGDDKISYAIYSTNKRKVAKYEYDVNYRAIDKLPKFFMDSIKEDKAELPKKNKNNKLFRFLDKKTDYAKDIKELLESDENKAIIDRINYIIEAYKYINEVISSIRSSEESAKATINTMESYINMILQMQYSQDNYARYSEEIVPSLVSYLIESTDHASIQDMVDRFYDRGWMYTLSDKRLSELYRILQWNDGIPFESREECEKILTNFNNQGYFLLFYVLKEVFKYFEKEKSIPDKVTEGESKIIDKVNNLCEEGKKYYYDLKARYISDQKINYLGCRKDSMEVCLSDIKDELSKLQVSEEQKSINPSNLVLPVLWEIHNKGSDGSGNFFWELVTLEDLEHEFMPASASPEKKKTTKKSKKTKENENVR